MAEPANLREPLRKLVRHDLRGPLGIIAGHCELLEEGIGGELTDRQRRSVEAIRKQVDRLEEMFERLSGLVSIEAAREGGSGPAGPSDG